MSFQTFSRKLNISLNIFCKKLFPSKSFNRNLVISNNFNSCLYFHSSQIEKLSFCNLTKQNECNYFDRNKIHTSSFRLNEFVINIQDQADFQKRVIKNPLPVILDFFATWCGPCKLLVPKLEALANKYDGKIVLAKVDIDELTEIADEYNVSAVPTVIAFKNGKEVDKFVGFKEDAALETFISKLIK